jgi:hypothetical protein
MKIAIAYVLLLILGPTVGGLGSLVLAPVVVAISRKGYSFIGGAVTGVAEGVLTAWFGTILFGWFGLTASWVMLLVLGVGSLLNDLYRLATRGATRLEFGFLVGGIGGLVLAGFVLLP